MPDIRKNSSELNEQKLPWLFKENLPWSMPAAEEDTEQSYFYREDLFHQINIGGRKKHTATVLNEQKNTYIRLLLSTPFLRPSLRMDLESLGVNCLEEGGAYEAYGIVDNLRQILRVILGLREVLAVEVGEPSGGK